MRLDRLDSNEAVRWVDGKYADRPGLEQQRLERRNTRACDKHVQPADAIVAVRHALMLPAMYNSLCELQFALYTRMLTCALCTLTCCLRYGNALSGVIPDSMFVDEASGRCRLPRLNTLSLGRNWLHGEIPVALCKCTSIRSLSLQLNSLTGAIPEAMNSKLCNLIYLNLSDNALSGVLPDEFGGGFPIRPITINIARNSIRGVAPASLLAMVQDEKASIDYAQNMIAAR